MAKVSREQEKLIIALYTSNTSLKEITNIVNSQFATEISKRTVERKIKAYNEGLMPYCDNIVEGVSQFEKEQEDRIMNIVKSKGYADIVEFSLKNITEDRVLTELNTRGVRPVVTLIGTLIDKRLKSYTVDLEKENLALKK